jgi:hypothetical protein
MHNAVPIAAVPGRNKVVSVAMMDPHNLLAIDEIGAVIGARVEPLAAPELRILHLLERVYGIKRKKRTFIRVSLDRPIQSMVAEEGPAEEATVLSAPPPPRDLKRNHGPVPGPAASRQPRRPAPTPMPSRFISPRETGELMRTEQLPAIESVSLPPPAQPPAAELPRERQPEPEPKAPTVLLSHPLAESPRDLSAMGRPPSSGLASEAKGQVTPAAMSAQDPAEALASLRRELEHAQHRDEVGDAIAHYLGAAFGIGLVLIVKGDLALGWKGVAPDVSSDVMGSIVVPLQTASPFKMAFEQQQVFRGPPPGSQDVLLGRLYRLLGCAVPPELLVAPVVLGKRIVNLVYAHPLYSRVLPITAEADLTQMAMAAATAYQRIIVSRQNPR